MVSANVEVEEVDDFSELQTIDEVPDRSSKNTDDRELPPPVIWFQSHEDRTQ